ncbi:MAG: hypothetical protein LBK41_06015 [Clostridiales bacterium]|jgi:hypothetical protein|nr:hypothetical protein [Clostridiales bacterium]
MTSVADKRGIDDGKKPKGAKAEVNDMITPRSDHGGDGVGAALAAPRPSHKLTASCAFVFSERAHFVINA